jgi:uncharacterized protein (TIGR04255 family)
LKEGDDIDTYLVVPPELPDGVPSSVSSFLQRVTINEKDFGSSINLTQVLEGGTPPGHPVPVILDIDVYRVAEFPIDTDEVWNYLENLRSVKNRFFFRSLTPAAIAIYS